ncbi:MAG: superoxide dismutase [Candidatus Vogelbacteria bacterium GWA1_51_14]|uniref:Superoxide dismutase n=1 Tax=Candidatus Vogelbacteria bacterium GWA1_51_14 TaxID=1802435 RepID=A0A1G2Q8X3_9BACT|nr:MAG: superoxide dismutase [Candidatus Vogelbacteria bacterium GWA1_51_14]
MHTLPTLTYNYNALAPVIDEVTMKLHHGKHHQGYVDKLNMALEKYPELADLSLPDLLADFEVVPDEIRSAVRNHGGGHYNHSLFWTMLTPVGSPENELPLELEKLLIESFGSLIEFKQQFEAAGLARFGSGWVWLARNQFDRLEIITTANQDTPLEQGAAALLGVDVWEHAYYLNYQNRRADYLAKIWSVVNWQTVAKLAKL